MSNVLPEEECRDTNGDGDCMKCATVPANWLCPKKAVHLTKWPKLIVVGDSVTPEQAMEIIIRTQCVDFFHSNERAWQEIVKAAFAMPEFPSLNDPDPEVNRATLAAYQAADMAARESMGILDIEYLHNARILSSWIGGPHGWCDWDGTIGCANYNIGKWPEESEVTAEWVRIAAAFPFLNLQAQLITDEGEGYIATQHSVSFGHVTLIRRPKHALMPRFALKHVDDAVMASVINIALGTPGREQGCTAEKLHEAIHHTKRVIAERTTT